MAKAIIWRRGSTDKQEIETQDKDLTAMAIADGFNPKDLIHLGEAGASAIKQNDLYKMEVEQLLLTLNNDQTVKTVYVWEISRLARNELAFYQMKDYFVNNKVQLICKTPSLRLFDVDHEGKPTEVNKGAELTLSLLLVLAKQEMEIKQARFKRAKTRNKAEGKYNGGRIKIGYQLDKSGHFVVDEEKAQVIRNIYHWFVVEGLSLNKIYYKLVDMGIYHSVNLLNTCGKRVGYLLRDVAYKGEKGYPRLVNDEIWARAQEKMTVRTKPHDSKNVYYCKGLLKDKETGYLFTAKLGRLGYVMRSPDYSAAININAMDYIAFTVANHLLTNVMRDEATKNIDDYKLRIVQNKTLIQSKQKQIEELEATIGRAIEMNIAQPKYYPKDRMEATIKRNEQAIERLKTDIINHQTQNTRMENYLNGNLKFDDQLYEDYSDSRKKELIDKVILKMEVTKIGEHHFTIEVTDTFGHIYPLTYEYMSRGNSFKLIQHGDALIEGDDSFSKDITEMVKKHKRFERKRY